MPRREQHFSEMLKTQVTLAEYPSETVLLTCDLCGRKGKLSKAKLIAEHGAGVGLVNLLNWLSRDCGKMKPDPWGNKACRARYENLT